MKERIIVVELMPDGKMVKHKAIQQRSNKRSGRKPARAIAPSNPHGK